MREPSWMNHLMAKSKDMGGQTLAQHTWDVLSRMADQKRLHPHLNTAISDRLWSQAFWAAFLHDFGKAADGFQEVLRGEKGDWWMRKHRHEVLSLGFVDWLFPQGHPDRLNVIAMVICHHKDASPIFDKYGGIVEFSHINDEQEKQSLREMLTGLAKNITAETAHHLWRWIDECAHDWAAELGFTLIDPPKLKPFDEALIRSLDKAIFRALRHFHDSSQDRSFQETRPFLLLRGLILSADHSASAGVTAFPDMPLTRAVAEGALNHRQPRDHQVAAALADEGSAILAAPTGSGKTEAAMLWAASQLEKRSSSRLFYTLPYQASMNAMYARLSGQVLGLSPEAVKSGSMDLITIRHSRALLKFYQDMMSLDEQESHHASKQARWMNNKADLNVHPIQIFSPYQMLKVAYSLKGFEALLLDYTDALFIFDEIHAYDPKRLALIIELMRWLRDGFNARFLIMTATLPPMLTDKLMDALSPQVITATPEEFVRSRRHRVEIIDGRLIDSIIEHVSREWQAGHTILICLNRVADAQKVYRLLRDELEISKDDIVLLHSRFNGRDRSQKEAKLLERAGVGRASRMPFICVATQVVEVSLNVDFDTIYTDPAPLEALIQRFGRVNRGRDQQSGTLPVHVFRQPSAEGEKPFLPYSQSLVESSLRVLEAYCGGGREIDEALVTQMLGEIYSGETLAEWENEYKRSADEFVTSILGTIRPFESADIGMQQNFYNMFDGIEVVPSALLPEYEDARHNRQFLEATQYAVSIPYRTYKEFRDYCLITSARELEGDFFDHIDVEYSDEFGLDIDGARQAVRQNRELAPWEDAE